MWMQPPFRLRPLTAAAQRVRHHSTANNFISTYYNLDPLGLVEVTLSVSISIPDLNPVGYICWAGASDMADLDLYHVGHVCWAGASDLADGVPCEAACIVAAHKGAAT